MVRPRATAPVADLGIGRLVAAILGAVLVVIGLVGFVDNPLIADPGAAPIFVTGTVHNMIHLATGFLSLYIAFALVGKAQADGLIGLGILFVVLVVLTVLSPNLFGILGPSPGYNVNLPDQLLHLVIGLVAIAAGVVSRRELARTGA
jgi:hypothetical protein